jgi:hypothetical protein
MRGIRKCSAIARRPACMVTYGRAVMMFTSDCSRIFWCKGCPIRHTLTRQGSCRIRENPPCLTRKGQVGWADAGSPTSVTPRIPEHKGCQLQAARRRAFVRDAWVGCKTRRLRFRMRVECVGLPASAHLHELLMSDVRHHEEPHEQSSGRRIHRLRWGAHRLGR